MSDEGQRPDELRAQVDRLKESIDARERPQPKLDSKSGATRIALDLMVCLGVGIFLGYWIDAWLDTKPWGILIGIGLGMAAGVKSAIRSAQAMEKSE